MNVNRVIHEARCLCWHEWYKKTHYISGHHCIHCDKYYPAKPDESYDRPDYTGPVNYCALMDWMREDDRGEALCDYDYFVFGCTHDWIELPIQEQVNLIAEAIEAGVLK